MSFCDACSALAVTRHTFESMRWHQKADWSIEWRAKSHNPCVDGRGCGVVFLRSDVERVVAIKRRCRISFAAALRVWGAIAKAGPL